MSFDFLINSFVQLYDPLIYGIGWKLKIQEPLLE
jgi:hypothetical protein